MLTTTLWGKMKTTMNIEAEWYFMKNNAFGLKKIRSEMAEISRKNGCNHRSGIPVNNYNLKITVIYKFFADWPIFG